MNKQILHTARQFGAGLFMAAALMCCVPVSALADDRRASEPDPFFGSSTLLNVLGDLYWRRAFGLVTIPVDQNGNAVVGGIALLPLPDAPGDGTPGSIDITLKAGQAFFLPLLAMFGTSYSDGTPSDPFVTRSVFKKHLKQFRLQVDGRTILDEKGVLDFLTGITFEPPIAYDAPPVNAITIEQGLSILHRALPPGTHVIQLDEKITAMPPILGGDAEFHNTFNVTVLP